MYQQLINLELKTDSNGAIRGYSKASNLKNTVQIPLLEDDPFLCNLCRNILNINIFVSLLPQQMQSLELKEQESEDETDVDDNIERSSYESTAETDTETPEIETVTDCQFNDNSGDVSSHENISESNPEIPTDVENRVYPCDFCGTSFNTRFTRYHHYRKRVCSRPHERKRPPYSCEVCNKILKTRRGYLLHLKKLTCSDRSSNFTELTCSECQKTFKTKVGLRTHRFLHLADDQRPFRCEICKRGFATKLSFEIHELVHKRDIRVNETIPESCDCSEKNATADEFS